MAYDHARKAGNKGDVWKHFALVSVVDRLANGPGFRYVDVHSGAPSYQLGKSGEWKSGIAAVLETCNPLRSHSYLVAAAAAIGHGTYLSSWKFVVGALATRCSHVEIVLTDTADAVAALYKDSPLPEIPKNTVVFFKQSDGFGSIESLTQADLVLIDPPFNPDAASDWRQTRAACGSLLEKGLPFLAWYPVYANSNPAKLVAGTGCPSWEVIWAPIGLKPSQNIKGCGILASNGLAEIMQALEPRLEALASCLGGTLHKRLHAS